jgi:hypothetical protein
MAEANEHKSSRRTSILSSMTPHPVIKNVADAVTEIKCLHDTMHSTEEVPLSDPEKRAQLQQCLENVVAIKRGIAHWLNRTPFTQSPPPPPPSLLPPPPPPLPLLPSPLLPPPANLLPLHPDSEQSLPPPSLVRLCKRASPGSPSGSPSKQQQTGLPPSPSPPNPIQSRVENIL